MTREAVVLARIRGAVYARGVGAVGVRRHVAGMTHIVRVHRQVRSSRGGICRGHPSVLVYLVVIRAGVARGVHHTHKGVVARHRPRKRRPGARVAETQVVGGAVHVVSFVKPHARQVDRHVYLFAGVCVVAEDPQLVVLRVDGLVPHIGEDDVGGELVLIAAIHHQFGLHRECSHHPCSLRQREKAYVVSFHREC